jgi:polyketide biosynthesis acyl carrier protein
MNREGIGRIVEETIVQIVPDLKGKSIDFDTTLEELGADSVDRSEILVLCLEALSLNVRLVELAAVRTPAELTERLSHIMPHA